MKVTLKGFVYESDFGDDKSYHIFSTDGLGDKWYTLIGPVEFEYTIPEGWDARPVKLAILDKNEAELKAKFAAAMMEIGQARANLLAIGNAVEVQS